jgi:peptidoglycan/LPS O-acetylase OafA/YrhL
MTANNETQGRRSNGFGALRLLFASLVIVAHSVELHDGDNTYEPLFRIFGTLTFGSLAVDAFFLISGYLIASSFISAPRDYLEKRVRRIYPGFLVCYLLCVLLVAPLAGAKLSGLAPSDWGRIFYRMFMLKAPEVPGSFAGMPVNAINGSTWTISYEFRCYLLAALFGVVGLYKRPKVFVLLTGVVLLASVAMHFEPFSSWNAATPATIESLFGKPLETTRLLAAFMTGTSFMLLRPRWDGRLAAAAGLLTLPLLFVRGWSEAAIAVLGGYLLFWCAFRIRQPFFLKLNAREDISYGVYLYAFPLGNLILLAWRDIPIPLLGVLTFAAAAACGWASWKLIEKPALSIARAGRRDPGPARESTIAESASSS